jgi:hypothetical protein
MPAFDLSTTPHSTLRYDVIGQTRFTEDRFVTHVALSDSDISSLRHGANVSVTHMGPPLEGAWMSAHALGSVPLTNEERHEIEAWIHETEDEYYLTAKSPIQQYWIHPPWKDRRDPNTGVRRHRRYSCAGFALDAHRQVGIDLLDIQDSNLPPVGIEQIEKAYPNIPRSLLCRFGLTGDGPWRVVLAGYVLHALDRSTNSIRSQPYTPQPGDEYF